ncbi:MAG: type II toxin-antitoxin system VapC family toxin [Bryobacteraceae bacterium]|nr:type II toxin-antitoxin system VapC family toxin [Bryobacteraceae bacterium]
MAFVLDASVTACWANEDENDSRADIAFGLLGPQEALVPALWWFEVRNMLVVNERRQRLTLAQSAQFLALLTKLPIVVDSLPDEDEVLRLARTYRLTVYDSAYLELALRRNADLATLDGDLAKAARTEGVAIV